MAAHHSIDRGEILARTAEIVAAHVANNAVAGGEVGALIQSVFDTLPGLATDEPAVTVRRSVTPALPAPAVAEVSGGSVTRPACWSAVEDVVADLGHAGAALEPPRADAASVEEQRAVRRVGDGAGQHCLRGGKGGVAVGAIREGLRAAVAAVGELAAFGHHRAGCLGKFAALGAVQNDVGDRGAALCGFAAGLKVNRLSEAGNCALGRRILGGGSRRCGCEQGRQNGSDGEDGTHGRSL
jgi:hypothetical protein